MLLLGRKRVREREKERTLPLKARTRRKERMKRREQKEEILAAITIAARATLAVYTRSPLVNCDRQERGTLSDS